MSMMRQLTQTRTAGAGQDRRSQAAPDGEPPTTPAAAPEGYRPLPKQAMVSQQSELEEGEALQRSTLQQPGSSPSTTGLCQNQLTQDQCFQLEWARLSTYSAVKLEIHISQVLPHRMRVETSSAQISKACLSVSYLLY